MAVLSRLGPQVGFSARPHLIRISSAALGSHTLQHGHLSRTTKPRTSVPGGRRNFSVGPAIDTAVLHVQDLITNLHVVTGTPWYITIPLVALGVNLLRVPLNAHSRKLLQKQQELNPVILAWRTRHMQDAAIQGAKGALTLEQYLQTVQKKTKQTMKRIYKDHGLQSWKLYASSLAIFPVWLSVIEALRRMSGGPTGLLGMLSQLWSGKKVDEAVQSGVSPASAGEGLSGPKFTPIDSSALPAPSVPAPVPSDVLDPGVLGYDPSLSTGGCLWFPDLTAADPLHVLPYMLSGILFVNLLPKSMEQFKQILNLTPSPEQQANPWPFRIRRALMILALAVGPLTANLPAAVHLYWISSSGFNLLQSKIMGRVMPIRRPELKHCKPQPRYVVPLPPKPSPPPMQAVKKPGQTGKKP
jgi:inner membrane protein COX18